MNHMYVLVDLNVGCFLYQSTEIESFWFTDSRAIHMHKCIKYFSSSTINGKVLLLHFDHAECKKKTHLEPANANKYFSVRRTTIAPTKIVLTISEIEYLMKRLNCMVLIREPICLTKAQLMHQTITKHSTHDHVFGFYA